MLLPLRAADPNWAQGVLTLRGDYPVAISTPSDSGALGPSTESFSLGHQIAGVVRNADGSPYLGGATVVLLRDSDYAPVQTSTSSLADGSYSFLRDDIDPYTYAVWAYASVPVASLTRNGGIDDPNSGLRGVAQHFTPSKALSVDTVTVPWAGNNGAAFRIGIASSFAKQTGVLQTTVPWLSYVDMPQHTLGVGVRSYKFPPLSLVAGTQYMLTITGSTGATSNLGRNYQNAANGWPGTNTLVALSSIGAGFLYIRSGVEPPEFESSNPDWAIPFTLSGPREDITKIGLVPA